MKQAKTFPIHTTQCSLIDAIRPQSMPLAIAPNVNNKSNADKRKILCDFRLRFFLHSLTHSLFQLITFLLYLYMQILWQPIFPFQSISFFAFHFVHLSTRPPSIFNQIFSRCNDCIGVQAHTRVVHDYHQLIDEFIRAQNWCQTKLSINNLYLSVMIYSKSHVHALQSNIYY